VLVAAVISGLGPLLFAHHDGHAAGSVTAGDRHADAVALTPAGASTKSSLTLRGHRHTGAQVVRLSKATVSSVRLVGDRGDRAPIDDQQPVAPEACPADCASSRGPPLI
jgi:hypothetical protein